MLKSIAVAAALLTLGVAPAAYADGPSPVSVGSGPSLAYVGDVSYSFEAERLDASAGVEVDFHNGFSVTPSAEFEYSNDDFTFAGVDVLGEYEFNDNVTGYSVVSFDGDFAYTELEVGASFRF